MRVNPEFHVKAKSMSKSFSTNLIEQATEQQLGRVLGLTMNDNVQWQFLSAALADRSIGGGSHAAMLTKRG